VNGKRGHEDLEIACKVCNIAHYARLRKGRICYHVTWLPEVTNETSGDAA
jgi:hypothetical protein